MAKCQAHFQTVDVRDGAVLTLTTTWPVVMCVNLGRVSARLDVLGSLTAPEVWDSSHSAGLPAQSAPSGRCPSP